MTVTEIAEAESYPDEKESSLKYLRQVIKDVEDGTIRNIAISWTTKEGNIGRTLSAGSNTFLRWMSMCDLERHFHHEHILIGGDSIVLDED